MNKLKISSSRLEGQVTISGAKNSALKLLAASLLTRDRVCLTNYPSSLADCDVHVQMLEALGKKCIVSSDDSIEIVEVNPAPSSLAWKGRSIRNTLLILGVLTARTGAASVPLPGGCNLGDRAIDLHEYVLRQLGAEIWQEENELKTVVKGGRLKGAEIHLRIRSTGATENAILCGSLAQGTTTIWNPHIRPEILDLIAMLRTMGAKIKVFSQERIEVIGVDHLEGACHRVIPDSMEAITWLAGGVMTRGDVEIVGFPYGDLCVVLAHLEAAGAQLYRNDESLIVRGGKCYPIEISTGPHPGINSDVQPILAAWAACARGWSTIVDLRFPGRYGYAEEMAKMGVKYSVQGDMLVVEGNGGQLKGASVCAVDLRAGASLALCGLVAQGETTITDAWQITRGYANFAEKLRDLGADAQWKN